MARAFRAEVGGAVSVALEAPEQALLIALLEDLRGLLQPAAADDPLGLGLLEVATPSDDPVLARLLPDAYIDDEDAAGEFRRLTEHGLRTDKAARIERMVQDLRAQEAGEWLLPAGAADTWMLGLNDLRLALAGRMGLGVDAAPAAVPSALADLYDWLTWLQDSLIDAVTGGADTLPT